MDQNEKLNMYDVTYVLAMDGHSGMIVGAATMVRKNNIVIYDEVFREICQTYGLIDRVIVEHGMEFFLVLFMQQKLHYDMRYLEWDDLGRCYKKMRSVHNNRIERIWVEVNRCATYPIKNAVAQLFRNCILDEQCDFHRFSVGETIRPIADFAMRTAVDMWNNSPKPGRGGPTDHVPFSNTRAVDWNLLMEIGNFGLSKRALSYI